jgi:3-isopropylmalate/(R)-2-methylmalate dehydratase small subunit
VWALVDYGFKAVISPRFGDIFRGNSLKAGLLTVVLDEKVVQRLWDDIEDDPSTEVTVDLVERNVRWSGEVHGFELDDYTRWRLLEGLDDIGLTLRHTDEIAAYEAQRKPWLPSTSVSAVNSPT